MTSPLQRDLNYRLTADPTRMEKGFKSAEASARVFERELAKLEAQQRRVDDASTQVGAGLIAAGAAISAGLFLATRAAVQWESQWAGVTKAIEGTPQQLAALEGELRDLATTLNVANAHEQVAAVAEAAGQLGVRREDIASFTKTMIDMGISTNLAADEAATAIARLSNIMGTAPQDVRRLASSLVALGNDGASTEAEIVEMALRIAGAGRTIGLTEDQVLAFANTLSSVGIEAEAGGSAISRVFVDIEGAVRSGGEKLETFATVAGGTSAQFVAAYQQDAAAAITAFIMGLGRMQAAGGNVFGVLEQLSLSEIRVRDALLRLANAGDLTSHSLQVGARAWQENLALTEEANRRYDTAAARLDGARNRLNDFAISMGQTFLPAVAKGADVVATLADGVNSLPGPVKTAAALVALFAAALALTGGAALVAVPRIHAARQAIDTLANSSSRAWAATGRVASVLTGPWGLAIAGAITLATVFAARQAELKARTQELAGTFDETTGAITENTRVMVAHRLQQEQMSRWAELMGLNLATLTDVVLGDADAIAQWEAAVARARTEFTGNAAPALEEFIRDVEAQRAGFRGAAESAEELRQATQGTTDATSQLPPEQRKLAEQLRLTATEAQSAGKQIDDLDKELRALLDTLFGLEASQDDIAAAWEELREQVKQARGEHEKGATSLTANTEAARNNRSAVRDLVEMYAQQITILARNGATTDQLAAAAKQYRDELVKQLVAMGFSRTEAEKYAAALGQIPALVATTITTPGMATAKSGVDVLQGALHDLEGTYAVLVRQRGSEQARARVAELHRELARLQDRTVKVTVQTFRVGAGAGRTFGMQHGGQVRGPAGIDAVPIMATAGEFVSTVAATSRNRAALEAANSGARLMVAPAGSATGTVGGSAATVSGMDSRSLARTVGREVARALDGVTLIVDDRGFGRLVARDADRIARGG